ncbi:Glycosylphosphatidylinositol:protein transamidase complex, GAA1 component [Cordyceps fumosorosea ARSEF 2679]|uniref:Glycosylphosphatidylinositol:protein transamidase complex, GAA1 component n=1 Tax=Cordyceps fumosorosea (strain ARSEF 2679) TaxID=1081104 RepID=A0A162LPH6_CORFA|nr:Glycosylphosphatidylinositol:protein transamidase complex, GAA1 component [Cordyceps fumosorosea ARSEF 2679]OAA73754.1 Glycosylphosphatidylinositol:protein transamidase complex, GAA1 component [Cordyceps fumosorosea ARSEF 2679]
MERFENEYGTLTSLALFFGPLTTVPALLYLAIEATIFRMDNAIMGASIWVFLLLGMEAIRTYRSNPHLIIGTHHIPTWTTPLLLAFVVAALVPSSSLLGHLCGLGVGYIAGLGYVKYIAPPEWALRWLESKLKLITILPHYVSVDQKTYGRFGVLPSTNRVGGSPAIELVGTSAMALRRDPRMLKLPPYLSLACIVVGFAWLLVLPLDNYSRRTYISENALLPGQVHTYFGGSEQNIFRAYRREVDALENKNNHEINDQIEVFLKEVGVKVGRQNYTYHYGGNECSGENIYGILQAPRGDATEAIVLVAAWKTVKEEINRNGVTLALTLARYFKRWSLWSKDIIIVIPPDSKAGTQAWVDAYHDAHNARYVAPLPLKSGALQGALALDYAVDHRFEALHIIYDGTNGQLPNLDLINSMVNIAGGQMGVHTAIQGIENHSNSYKDRLHTILRGMVRQSLGLATGPHSSFIPYHVDAITLQPYGEGWHDEMALGRIVEGTFRSLNNLLEHLHQSFFFYLLMHRDHFVSIGTYLPSAMLLAANFSIMAIFLWVKSGQAPQTNPQASGTPKAPVLKTGITQAASTTVERDLFLPISVVTTCQALSVIPLFVFNNISASVCSPSNAFSGLSS